MARPGTPPLPSWWTRSLQQFRGKQGILPAWEHGWRPRASGGGGRRQKETLLPRGRAGVPPARDRERSPAPRSRTIAGEPVPWPGVQCSPKTWAESEQQRMSTPLTASQPVRSQGVCAGPGEGVQGAGLEVLPEALGWGVEPTRVVQRRPQTPGGTRCPWRTRVVVRKPQPS